MVCGQCGTANTAGRKFCLECGALLASACPSCGAGNEPGAKFCGECGIALTGGAATSLPARTAPASRAAERRIVSVLFADLVGFTTLAAERDPEAVRELLTRYFETCSEVIGRFGGSVEKFIGDAVMAVWGAPVAHEDDAERAVRAALELVGAVRALGSEAAVDLQVRAGILTGEAAVTLDAQNQGLVAGDLVNTASRLQSIAPPGTVLVGEATRLAAGSAIAFEPVGEQLLKGRPSPVAAFRALRVVGERASRPGGRSELLEPPFVGRAEQLRLLQELVHATGRERRARLVSIVGQGGIGKSRLAWELEKYLDGVVETVYWHIGRSPAYGEGITFWALGEMIRRRAGLAETDDERTTRSAVASMLAEWVADPEERRWIEPRLLNLLGIGESKGGREELFAAWRTFFERVAEHGTTILVFEDLQWADGGLLDFIDHLLEWSARLPIFVLSLARPELLERRPGWGSDQRNAVSVRLEPLSDGAMRELLGGLVPGLPEAAVRAILERADGIPLYAVETVRMLVADGRLSRVGDAYKPVGDLSTLAVPPTLQALVAARLDGLDPSDRSLVQDAAVLGQSFTPAALAAVSGVDAGTLEPRLRALARREFLALQTDPRSPERGQYAFVQALVRDVAYGTLARRDRRARHLAAARHFEALGDEELAGALAAQYVAAFRAQPEGPEGEAVAAQARIALRAAAERAVALGSNDQAIAHLRQALEVTPESREQNALLERIGEAAFTGGRWIEGEEALRTALGRWEGEGDVQGAVRTRAELAWILLAAARVSDALAALQPAVDQALALGQDPAAARFAEALGRAYFRSDDHARAVEWAEQAIALGEPLGLEADVVNALVTKASALVSLGRRREGLALLDGASRVAERLGLVVIALRAGVNLAAFTMDEDPAASLARSRADMQVARRLGLRGLDPYHISNATTGAERTGDWDWLVSTVGGLRAEGHAPEVLDWLAAMEGEILVWRGEPIERLVEETRRIAERDEDPQGLAAAAALAARVAFVRGDFAAGIREQLAVTGSGFGSATELRIAAHCALQAADLGAAREILGAFERLGARGAAAADRLALEAGISALEGHLSEAVAAYRTVMDRYGELGLRFDLALTGLDMAALLDGGDR